MIHKFLPKPWAELSIQEKAKRSRYPWYIVGVNDLFNRPKRLLKKFYSPNIFVFAENRLNDILTNSRISARDEKKFNLPWSNDKNHRQAVTEMFQFLAEQRRLSWINLDDDALASARQHALTELDSLRSEIVDLKTQITSSERVTGVWMVGSVFAYSKDIVALYPILFFPLILSLFGFIRFKEFQRNVFDLDCYLRELELTIRPDSGWVTYFFQTRSMERFFDTRQYFWIFALVLSALIPIAGFYGVLGPNSIRFDLLRTPVDPMLDCIRGDGSFWACLITNPSAD